MVNFFFSRFVNCPICSIDKTWSELPFCRRKPKSWIVCFAKNQSLIWSTYSLDHFTPPIFRCEIEYPTFSDFQVTNCFEHRFIRSTERRLNFLWVFLNVNGVRNDASEISYWDLQESDGTGTYSETAANVSAFLCVYLGSHFLKKVHSSSASLPVSVMLFLLAINLMDSHISVALIPNYFYLLLYG